MSQLSAIEPPRVAPASDPAPQKRAPEAKPAEEVISNFAVQGATAFLAGGLIALIASTASVVEIFEKVEFFSRLIGFALGGAIGGAGMLWGSARKHAPRNAAFGFALGFIVAAYVAGAGAGHLLSLKPEAYGIGTFVGSAMAMVIGYGTAGAIGGAFVMGRLFFAGAVRFGLAGLAGSFLLSMVPSFNIMSGSATPGSMVGLATCLLAGHLIPFVGGAFWFGRAVAAEERALRKKPAPRTR